MKIIKHTFELPNLQLDQNGELIEGTPIYKTCTFTLLHGGIGRFEETYGKPLMSKIMEMNKAEGTEEERGMKLIADRKFILDLAGASYVKIENNKFENNRATMDEFINSDIADHVMNIDFITKLFEMTTECVIGKVKETKEVKGKNK